jgi:hypothetical protein
VQQGMGCVAGCDRVAAVPSGNSHAAVYKRGDGVAAAVVGGGTAGGGRLPASGPARCDALWAAPGMRVPSAAPDGQASCRTARPCGHYATVGSLRNDNVCHSRWRICSRYKRCVYGCSAARPARAPECVVRGSASAFGARRSARALPSGTHLILLGQQREEDERRLQLPQAQCRLQLDLPGQGAKLRATLAQHHGQRPKELSEAAAAASGASAVAGRPGGRVRAIIRRTVWRATLRGGRRSCGPERGRNQRGQRGHWQRALPGRLAGRRQAREPTCCPPPSLSPSAAWRARPGRPPPRRQFA